jgi:guanyl-specific ribonuclease Sa
MRRLLNPSVLGGAILVLATIAALWSINHGFQQIEVIEPPGPGASQIPDVTVRDPEGQVVFRGPIDLGPTLQRIALGERLSFAEDGSPFSNSEGHLPAKPEGYYTQYVNPTPQLTGPGPQRIVLGRDGEIYYSPDASRPFVPVR